MTTEPYQRYLPPKPDAQTVDFPRDRMGNTYLHELCRMGAPPALIREAVETLGANVNALNRDGLPPLAGAIMYAPPETTECLIALGAKLYLPAHNGTFFNATYMASALGQTGALETILAHQGGLYVNEAGIDSNGTPSPFHALHAAVKNGYTALVAPLVAAGAFASACVGPHEETPLMLAVLKSAPPLIRRLIEEGAALEQRTGTLKRTPLLHALSARLDTSVDTLISLGADVNAQDANGDTALMVAIANNGAAHVQALLKAGANVNAQNALTGETALMAAARRGNLAIVDAILAAKPDMLLADKFNRTAHRYVSDNDYTGLRQRLETAETAALHTHFEASYKKYRP